MGIKSELDGKNCNVLLHSRVIIDDDNVSYIFNKGRDFGYLNHKEVLIASGDKPVYPDLNITLCTLVLKHLINVYNFYVSSGIVFYFKIISLFFSLLLLYSPSLMISIST